MSIAEPPSGCEARTFHAGLWSSDSSASTEGNHYDLAQGMCSNHGAWNDNDPVPHSAFHLGHHSSAGVTECSSGSSVLCTDVCLDLLTSLALAPAGR